MIISRPLLKQYMLIFFSCIFGGVIIGTVTIPYVQIAVFICLTIISLRIARYNVMHPYCWFTVFMTLYSISYPLAVTLYYDIAGSSLVETGLTDENVLLNYIGLCTYLIIVGPNNPTDNIFRICVQKNNRDTIHDNSVFRITFVLSTLLSIMIILLSRRGYSGKIQMASAHDMAYIISTYLTRFITYLIILMVIIPKYKESIKKIVICSAPVLLFSIYTGERDALLRLAAVLLLSFFAIGKLKRGHVFILVPIIVTTFILITVFKGYFLTSQVNNSYSGSRSIIYDFLSSEFLVSGFNLQVIINHGGYNSALGLGIFFVDIIGSVFPSSFYPVLFGSGNYYNANIWYNDTFYRGSSWSRAFTLTGEGYVIAGIFGIVLIYGFIALLTRIVMRKSEHSAEWVSIYIFFIVTTISLFRDTMSTLMSSLIRIPLLVLIMIWLMRFIKIGSRRNAIKY